MVIFLINHTITTVWQHRAVLIVVQRGAQWRQALSQHNFNLTHGVVSLTRVSDSRSPQSFSPCICLWTIQLHYKLNRTRTSEEAWKGASWPLSHFCSLFFVSAVCLQAVAGQRIGLSLCFSFLGPGFVKWVERDRFNGGACWQMSVFQALVFLCWSGPGREGPAPYLFQMNYRGLLSYNGFFVSKVPSWLLILVMGDKVLYLGNKQQKKKMQTK